jgi:type IV pilus assembly protein PilA
MLARIRKAQESEEGFTLIELLVVIIIIGILAAVAIPVFLNQRQKGWDAQAKSDLRNVATLQETYLTESGAYATLLNQEPAPATPVASTIYNVKKSPNATTTVVGVRNVRDSFCLRSVSDSGTSFYYDSAIGGLTGPNGAGTTACTAT